MFEVLNRRAFLRLIAMVGIAPGMSLASEDVLDLDWSDMIPPDGDSVTQRLQGLGILPHDEMSTLRAEQPPSSGVRTDFNGKIVRIPGYIVPLETSGSGVTEFILVPYVGACIHVPPPPANQLVFVTTQTPYESSGLFEAVNVTGMFGTASLSTQLADNGYATSAALIAPSGR